MDTRILWILSFGSLCLISSCSTPKPSSQPRIPVQNTTANRYETNESLLKKIALLKKQLNESPQDTQLLLQLASLYQEVDDVDNALKLMEQLDTMGYDEDPRLYGSMARIYKEKEDYRKSRESFLKFKSLINPSSPTSKKIDGEIEKLDFIINSLSHPYDINLRPFSDDINTVNSEYLPQFTLDDSSFIFTRRFFDQEDLFIAYKSDSGYTTSAIEELNTLTNEGAHTLSADGSLLIFTRCDDRKGFGSCDLYRSQRDASGTWSRPANMGQTINSRFWESQPSLSADGRILFFSSKREGGLGGSDIYASFKKKDGRWGTPKNLGGLINTPSNDGAPFIHPDGQTLYFRSTGHPKMGGHDLYMTKLEKRRWTKPLHLGSPINTIGEDGALVVSLDGTTGYYATNSFEGVQQKDLDLYRFDLPEKFRPSPMTFLKGRVVDIESGYPLEAEIMIHYLDSSNYKNVFKANRNGEFLAAIPVGKRTLLNINLSGYVFYSDHIFYEEVKYSVDPYLLSIQLSKIRNEATPEQASEAIVLSNIFFETGSDRLLPSSETEIGILYELLVDQPTIKIEITGHTDNIGTAEDNITLSKKRAESVKAALIKKGLTTDRISTIGAGESMPIATNETEEGRTKNRRTEFKIIG